MKFTLTYDGELPSGGNRNHRVREKWDIRKSLHPQLLELWQTHPVLKKLSETIAPSRGGFLVLDQYIDKLTEAERREQMENDPTAGRWEQVSPLLSVKNLEVMPLVRKSLFLACGLDILFLRKEEPGSLILQGGDIDNRIKTLFDALKMPSNDDFNGSELSNGPLPSPLYCLLESDSLISDFSIKTDRLLTAPNSSPLQVRLVIGVTIKVLKVRTYNIILLSE
jgi:hypothetical protein